MLIKAEGITMEFGGFKAVSGASLTVNRGEIVGLIGPNGAGKSTFFNCLAGDLRPTHGQVWFDGVDLTNATPEEHARRGIGRTFQLPATFEDLTILENVMVGAVLRHPSTHDATMAAWEILELTGLSGLARQRARSLGTPGRKRLEIARVLATQPKLMLLDEALAGLTPVEVQRAIELVRRIHQTGVTIVIVEHIMEVILSLTDRVLVFNQGQIIASGVAADVVNDPAVIEAYLGRPRTRKRGGTP